MITSKIDISISRLHHSYWTDASGKTHRNQIARAHFQEWTDSAVDPELIALNVRSLSGDEAYRELIPDPVAVTSRKQKDAQWRSRSKRYSHLENGGWWCSSIDPTTGQLMDWGCFKPSTPRPDFEKPGKTIKYEHPFGASTRAFFLNVPLRIWQLVSQRYNVALPSNPQPVSGGNESVPTSASVDNLCTCTKPVDVSREADQQTTKTPTNFWQWVCTNKIPITIVEGAKKAGALLSMGIVAIAIPGIFSGYRAQHNECGRTVERSLIPDLQYFATKERQVNICFDYENRPRQIKDLTTAIGNLSRLFNAAGCVVKVCQLPGPEKGVDDFIVSRGADAYEQVYSSALTLDQWQVLGFFALSGASVTINQEYLGDLPLPDEAKLVAIKSGKGTGKTEWLIKIVADRINAGLPTLVLTHRVQLGQAICDRLGLPYLTEVRDNDTGMLLGFGLCVDSLHPKSQAHFDARYWSDALVIVDECEQVIWHTLNANTEVKQSRPEVISQLALLLRGALTSPNGGVILLDADLSDLSIEFVIGLTGVSVQPWIVLNEWQPKQGRKIYVYSKPEPMLAALEQQIKNGDRVMVITQAQKAKSKLGTINLESRWLTLFPSLKILRIDSDSVRDPNHPACGCISHLNEILPNYDIVICSPSIETGVSIDIREHFSSIWAFMQGVSPINTACQSVARLRELVPLHLWASKRGLSFVGNGSTNYKSLIYGQKAVFRTNLALVNISLDGDCVGNYTAIEIWGKMAARVNAGMKDYKTSAIAALKSEGHLIFNAEVDVDDALENRITAELKATKATNYAAYCYEVSQEDSKGMTQVEYDKMKAKKLKTSQERLLVRNYEINQRYSTDVTPELVQQDEDGLYPKLRLMYYLTVGRQHLASRDRNLIENMKNSSNGKLWIPDVNKALWSARVATLEILGVHALLTSQERCFRNTDKDLAEFGVKALQYRSEIKEVLGVTIPSNASPVTAFKILLEKIGLTLKYGGRDGSGLRLRYYHLETPTDGREAIFANWLAKDNAP